MEKINQSYKTEIRKKIKCIRDSISESFVKENSEKIADRLFSLNTIKEAGVILVYYSMKNEVNTHGIIENLLTMNKKVALPICNPALVDIKISVISSLSELKPGIFGIMEPDPEKHKLIQPETIDVVIVPGIAFDRNGNRIGYGKGYYDRFLYSLAPLQVKLGICFDFQLFDELPSDSHDVPVDCVITESFLLKRSKKDYSLNCDILS